MVNKDIVNKEKYIYKNRADRFNNADKCETAETEQKKRDSIANFVNDLSEEQREILKKQLSLKKARENYADYLKLVYGNSFIMTDFHRYLAQICDNIVKRVERANMPNASEDDIRKGKVRILLSVPPRSGKTETLTKCLPSWFVGRNPDKSAILTAYNGEFAQKFEDANREKTRQFGKELFGIEISESQDNKTVYQIKGHKGSVMGVGVLGGITGNGGELIIIDDPYKSSLEANNPTEREKLYSVFRDAILTRLQSRGNALIVIQTRWHENDLCGELAKTGDWIVINIPCVCDDEKHDPLHRKLGQTLCPELGFDALWAEQTKKAVGTKVWESLYQGKPFIDGGEIFTRDMIKHYTKATLPASFDDQVISCDLSFGGKNKTNDPCSIQVWGRVGANHYLLKRIKKRLTFVEMCDTIKNISGLFPLARKKIVEKKANGQAVIDSLNSVIGGFVAYDPKMTDKVGRANSVLPYFQAGNIFLPDSNFDKTIDEMEQEMMKFPNGEHDDEVDAMTQYLLTFEYRYNGKVCTDSFYSTFADVVRGVKL